LGGVILVGIDVVVLIFGQK